MDQKKKSPYNENSQGIKTLDSFHTFTDQCWLHHYLTSLALIYNWKSVSFGHLPWTQTPSPATRNLTPFPRNWVPYNLNNILSRRMNQAYFLVFWFLFVFFFFSRQLHHQILLYLLLLLLLLRQVPQPFQSVYVENRMMVKLMFHNSWFYSIGYETKLQLKKIVFSKKILSILH